MIDRTRALTTIYFLVLFALTLTCDANAALDRDQARAKKAIRPCLGEISRHVDYEGASRVEHWVVDLVGKNSVETKIVVKTVVYTHADEHAATAYTATCVVAGAGKIVKFRIAASEPESG